MLAFTPAARRSHPLPGAWERVAPDRLCWASAFASRSGVAELRKLLRGQGLEQVRKQWLVGVQRGVTHPEALDALCRSSRSDVRVPFGEDTLAADGLLPRDVFHPKTLLLANDATGAAAIVSTSGNLTHGGLVANVEQWLTWHGTVEDDEAVAFARWWDELWTAADPASPAFVARYAALRAPLPAPRRRQAGAAPSDADLRRARRLWVELASPPSGDSFNQLELMLNAHAFFLPGGVNGTDELPLTFEDARGNVYDAASRKLRYHGSDSGNGMWRIYLPTYHEGLRGYQDGDVLVRFTRTSRADHYLIELVPAASPAALAWLQAGRVARPPTTPPRQMGWS